MIYLIPQDARWLNILKNLPGDKLPSEQRAALDVALARAQVAHASRLIMQPLACWDVFTSEQRELHLDACLANLTRVRRRLEMADEKAQEVSLSCRAKTESAANINTARESEAPSR